MWLAPTPTPTPRPQRQGAIHGPALAPRLKYCTVTLSSVHSALRAAGLRPITTITTTQRCCFVDARCVACRHDNACSLVACVCGVPACRSQQYGMDKEYVLRHPPAGHASFGAGLSWVSLMFYGFTVHCSCLPTRKARVLVMPATTLPGIHVHFEPVTYKAVPLQLVCMCVLVVCMPEPACHCNKSCTRGPLSWTRVCLRWDALGMGLPWVWQCCGVGCKVGASVTGVWRLRLDCSNAGPSQTCFA